MSSSYFRPFEKPMESLFNFEKKIWKTLMNFPNKKRETNATLWTNASEFCSQYNFTCCEHIVCELQYELWVNMFLNLCKYRVAVLFHWPIDGWKKTLFYRCENSEIQNRVNEKQQILYELPIFIVAVFDIVGAAGAAVIIIVYGHYHLNDYRQILWSIFSIHNLKLLYAFINLLNFHTSNQIDD